MSGVTGGGAGAAQTVAIAARLALDVARDAGEGGPAAQAAALERRADRLAADNAAVFEAALASLRDTEHRALGIRMAAAAEVPGRIAEAAADVAELAAELARSGDPHRRADAIVAATLAEAAAASAAHLVVVNLTMVEDDPRIVLARAAAAAAARAKASVAE